MATVSYTIMLQLRLFANNKGRRATEQAIKFSFDGPCMQVSPCVLSQRG